MRARGDPAHVRGPRPGREPPGGTGGQVEQRVERVPRRAPVAAREQTARLGARIYRAVGRAHREREDARLGERAVDPRRPDVVAPAHASLAKPGEDRVGPVRVDGEALGSRCLERARRDPGAVRLLETDDRVTGRGEQARHLVRVGVSDRALRAPVMLRDFADGRGGAHPARHGARAPVAARAG